MNNTPPSGGWGWTAWESLSSKFWGLGFCWSNYGDGFSNNHFRSQELNPTMDSIEDRFFSGGKPSFFLQITTILINQKLLPKLKQMHHLQLFQM